MKCARHGCENEVQQSGMGRPRRFCSPACKSADYKRRRRETLNAAWVSPVTGKSGEAAMVTGIANPDTQVVLAVHEAIMLRNSFERLSVDARPELGALCEGMANVIGDGLLRYFKGAIE